LDATPQILLQDLENCNCPRVLEAWCKEKNLKTPDKRGIAYRLLDLATGEEQKSLIRTDLEPGFKTLYEEISQALDL
ncbi:MAG: hypothetical protein AAF959_23650, partial [Cyanobacteria bacterium P01_D01_bin.56]